jgi:cytochrome P450
MTEPDPVLLDVTRAADPFPFYERLRRGDGVHRAVKPNGDRAWLVTHHDDVRALSADPRLSLSKASSTDGYESLGLPPALDENLLNLDPPDHTRLRRLVTAAFTVRRVDALRPRIQAATDALVDAVAPAGHCDLVADIAVPLPITVICDLLGVPARDGAVFRSWTTAILRPHHRSASQDGALALKNMHAMMLDLIARKRAEPADDLISSLLAVREGDDRLSEDELVSLVFLLLLAGYENPVHFLTNAVVTLLAHPEAVDRLRAEPSPDTPVVAAAVEELLRLDAPSMLAIRRFPTEDVTVGTTTIPRGHTVMLASAAANRDPDAFPDPHRLDIDRFTRDGTSGHVSLGHGVHFCLGAALARAEGQVALWTLLRRLPDLALAVPPDQVRWRPDFRQRALAELPVTFTPTRVS